MEKVKVGLFKKGRHEYEGPWPMEKEWVAAFVSLYKDDAKVPGSTRLVRYRVELKGSDLRVELDREMEWSNLEGGSYSIWVTDLDGNELWSVPMDRWSYLQPGESVRLVI